MTDYTDLIDTETWAFIRKSEKWFPVAVINDTVENQRKAYDAMCRSFQTAYPAGVTSADHLLDGVPVRFYDTNDARNQRVVLYIHGGGYVFGGLNSHDDVCAEICSRTGFQVLSVDYRLAPEYMHPAPFEDCHAVFRWVQENLAVPIILCGDSAGGGLAAALAHECRTSKHLCGLVLIYPELGSREHGSSLSEHSNAPMLTANDIAYYKTLRSGGTPPGNDPRFSPMSDSDFTGLPPTVVVTAQCDPLASQGPEYCRAVNRAGGCAVCIQEPGLVHGYLRARHSVERARNSFSRIVDAITILGSNGDLTGIAPASGATQVFS